MVTHRDYNKEAVEAARSVLLEVSHILGEYRDRIVLVGGWVPSFICKSPAKPHIGSTDIDLAIDHTRISDEGYRSIQQLLIACGYKQDELKPYVFYRYFRRRGQAIKVTIDLLGREYDGTGKSHRHQKVQNIHIRKARGADLVFDSPIEVTLNGILPNGASDTVVLRVASLVSFVIMKSEATENRLKEKDSWDIYYCIRNFDEGIDGVVKAFKPYLENGLVKEGLSFLSKHFKSIDSIGPTQVADFEEVVDPDDRDVIRRDAYELVRYLLDGLGIK